MVMIVDASNILTKMIQDHTSVFWATINHETHSPSSNMLMFIIPGYNKLAYPTIEEGRLLWRK